MRGVLVMGSMSARSDRRHVFTDVVVVASRAALRAAFARSPHSVVVLTREDISRSVAFLCPCGCDEPLTINLDRQTGRAWRIRVDHETVSLMPSVWRITGCYSHFIVWESNIWWCDRWRERNDDEEPSPDDECWPTEMIAELRRVWKRRTDSGRE